MKRRSIILLVAAGVALTIAVILLLAYVCMTGRFSAVVYRYTGSGKWLYSTLYHGVKNGDTIEQVERLLGPGKETGSRLHSAVKKFAARNPSGWPDGCEENDKFLGFRLPGGHLNLQFRNGVLINFDPDEFQKYEELQIIG
ncbi:MAG: hypothetical protein ISS79_08825 [Phycisphaerae bacterium]|nr:hypothetical protein [Phycisphaerae bacterium]